MKDGDRDPYWPKGFYWSETYERPVYNGPSSHEVVDRYKQLLEDPLWPQSNRAARRAIWALLREVPS